MKKKYEFLEHTADIKFRVYGKTLNELFDNAALAVSNYLGRGKKIKSINKKKISIEAEDGKALLYAFLDELLYLLDAEEFVVSRAIVKIKGNKLSAEIFGDNTAKYKELNHIKAATYAEMYIKQLEEKKWEAQAVMDV